MMRLDTLRSDSGRPASSAEMTGVQGAPFASGPGQALNDAR